MRSLLYITSGLAVIALAVWAYRQNYETQDALQEVETLHRKIAHTRARLGILNAEWAYLNRPERLRDLANLNFASLELLPLQPEQFGQVDEIGYAPVLDVPITNPIDVSTMNAGEAAQ